MPTPELSSAEPAPTEPALAANAINLSDIAANRSIAQPTDEGLAERLIRHLATSYVRKENRFYHIDRPSEALSQNDLQRSFLIPAQALNNGQAVPTKVMKEVFDTAIVQMNPNPSGLSPCGMVVLPHIPETQNAAFNWRAGRSSSTLGRSQHTDV